MGMRVLYSDEGQVRTYYLQPEGGGLTKICGLHILDVGGPPDELDEAVRKSAQINGEHILKMVLKALGHGDVEIEEL